MPENNISFTHERDYTRRNEFTSARNDRRVQTEKKMFLVFSFSIFS